MDRHESGIDPLIHLMSLCCSGYWRETIWTTECFFCAFDVLKCLICTQNHSFFYPYYVSHKAQWGKLHDIKRLSCFTHPLTPYTYLNTFHVKHVDKAAATYKDTHLCLSTKILQKRIHQHSAWLVTLIHPHNINTPYDQIEYKNMCKLVSKLRSFQQFTL